MVAVNQGKADKSAGQIRKNFFGAFLGQLAVIDDRLGFVSSSTGFTMKQGAMPRCAN